MPDYYPTYLNLAGKKCVILGGGAVAQGKIAGLRDAGAVITVISPDATEWQPCPIRKEEPPDSRRARSLR